MYSLSYFQASCWTEYDGLRVSLRMTLAHSSPPCSQMCRYSCPWTTPPCTSLSLLTWGCPCVAWRFSTNHWPLTSTTSCLLIPLPSPTALSTQPPLLLLPHCAPPFHFLWHHLCVAGWSTDSSFSFSAQTPSSLITAPVPTHPPSPSRLVRRQCIPLLFFSLNKCLHFACFFPRLCFLFCPLLLLSGLIWRFKKDNSLWCCFIMPLRYLAIPNTNPLFRTMLSTALKNCNHSSANSRGLRQEGDNANKLHSTAV